MTIILTLVMKTPPNFYFVFNFWRLLLFEDLRGGADMINGYPAVRLELFHQRGVIIYTNMGLDDIRGSPRDLAGKTYARWGGGPSAHQNESSYSKTTTIGV